jgi:hypothetical protein
VSEVIPADLTSATRPHVYLAAPLSTHHSSRYDEAVEVLHRLFPDYGILSSRDMFRSNAEWRAKWALVLTLTDALAFIVDSDGCIGRGVWQEVHDAADRAIPVYLLHDGQIAPLAALQFDLSPFDNYRQCARVIWRPIETPA